MKALALYLIQVILASGILYGYYHWFLRNKEFHQYNRFYLLSAALVSLLLPLLQIPVYFENPETTSAQMLRGLQAIQWGAEGDDILITANQAKSAWNWSSLLTTLYWTVGSLLFVRLLISLYKINRLLRRHPVQKLEGIDFVNTEEPGTPFTFFRWLFWDQKIDLHSENGKQVFRHEVYHIQQKHSWDVMVMEMLRTVIWINPFFHLIRRELRAIHEFLADKFAVTEQEKWTYVEFLLMQAMQSRHRLVNPFFHSQIKRRIAMITNSQKTSHRYLRKVLALPIAALVLGLVAFKVTHQRAETAIWGPAMKVIVDPGHGGFDPGAKAPTGKITESELSLKIAQKMKELAPDFNIEVTLTRSENTGVNQALNKVDDTRARLSYAKNEAADAFISLHLNTAPEKVAERFSGFEAYISAKKQNTTEQWLASVLLAELGETYTTSPVIKTRKSTGVAVLDQNPLPAVLLELGYLSNQQDLDFVSKERNQELIALKILRALRLFKNENTDKSLSGMTENVLLDTIIQPQKQNTITLKNGESTNAKSTRLVLRGTGEQEPLYVLDGIIVEKPSNLVLDTLDPNRIKAINVLKDRSAIEKYGESAADGVVEIMTKNIPLQLKEVMIEDNSNRYGTVTDSVRFRLQEIEVEGSPLKEVEVEGRPSQKLGKLQEVIVQGRYTIQADSIRYVEVPTQTIKANNELNEVVVVGYSKNAPQAEMHFDKVEVAPQPQGGEAGWRKYLERQLDANIAVKNNAPIGKYTVRVQFLVDEEGFISNIVPLTMYGFGMEEEAIRVIKKGPKWVPARQNGQVVKAFRIQPITFVVMKEETVTTVKGRPKEEPTKIILQPTEPTISGTIYPNPANNLVNIQLQSDSKETITLRVMDINGQATGIIKKFDLQKGNNNLSLNTETLKKGTYLIQAIAANGKSSVYKMIKN